MKSLGRFFKSFYYAGRGVAFCILKSRNFRFHITAALYVLFFSRFYDFSVSEYVCLFTLFGLVMGLEGMNTALEQTCNAVTENQNERIKLAKDASAGAVLVSAFFAVCTAVVMFLKPNVIKTVYRYFALSPLHTAALCVSVVISVLFIFYEDVFKNGNKR